MTTANALDDGAAQTGQGRLDPGLALWLVAGLVAVACFALRGQLPWLVDYPEALTQRQLALAVGSGERFIVELESGKETARLGKALQVARALGLRLTLQPGD